MEPDKPVIAPAPVSTASADEPSRTTSRAAFRRRAWLTLLLVSLAVLGLDQASKRWADQALRLAPQRRMALVDNYLHLNYVRNPGAAWGFLARSPENFRHPFFVVISLAAIAFIVFIHARLEPGQGLLLAAISLVMGGALGNFLDRIRLRYVIDFIEIHWKHRYHWPTFNVADIAITVGVALLVLEMLFGPWWRRRRNRSAAGGTATT